MRLTRFASFLALMLASSALAQARPETAPEKYVQYVRALCEARSTRDGEFHHCMTEGMPLAEAKKPPIVLMRRLCELVYMTHIDVQVDCYQTGASRLNESALRRELLACGQLGQDGYILDCQRDTISRHWQK